MKIKNYIISAMLFCVISPLSAEAQISSNILDRLFQLVPHHTLLGLEAAKHRRRDYQLRRKIEFNFQLKRILKIAYKSKMDPNQIHEEITEGDSINFQKLCQNIQFIFQTFKYPRIEKEEIERVTVSVLATASLELYKPWLLERAVLKEVQKMSLDELANFENHVLQITK
jgi:hypothetical protein